MEKVSKERREIAKRVMRAMRHESARRPLADASSDGARHLVICTRDDSVGYAYSMVVQAGGTATVVVPAGDRPGLIPLTWKIVEQAALMEVPSPISPVSSMGMLVDYLAARTGEGDLVFRLALPSAEAAITEGELLSTPV